MSVESPITSTFRRRVSEGGAALVPYVTAGFPDPESTVELLVRIAESGADVIELGIPFSDPLADGPTIQRSSFLALERGMTTRRVLEVVRQFRSTHDTPVVLFTYLNPVLRFGMEAFCEEAVDSGAQGILLTDLPAGADAGLEGIVAGSGLDLIRLLAPTTPRERVSEVAGSGSGFLYYISRTGVTGARSDVPVELSAEVQEVRRAVDLPVAVGFGISDPVQAAAVGSIAEGVVVGSALIRELDEGGIERGAAFVASLRGALEDLPPRP